MLQKTLFVIYAFLNFCMFVYSKDDVCVPLLMNKLCSHYNMTRLPNALGHFTQEDVNLEIMQFVPLVEIGCSEDLQFLICSVFFPMCSPNYNERIPVCRPLCERAFKGCNPIMKEYGFDWPQAMSCEKFPVKKTSEVMCMDRPDANEKPKPPAPIASTDTKCECKCSEPLVTIPPSWDAEYRQNITTAGIRHCAQPCHSAHLSSSEESFMSMWLALWSFLCSASTLLVFLTFLIDTARFPYPERPIIFLSVCYFMVAAGFLTRGIFGHKIACSTDHPEMVRYEAGSVLCTVVFVLVYYFGMAAALWWVILSLTWFLAAGLKWSSEAITTYSWWFHAIGWTLPAAQAVVAVFAQAVDGDSVAGICSVGNHNLFHLWLFVLGPLIGYMSVGVAFLFGGFVSLFRIRHVIKAGGTKTDKLEKLMIRIGVFSVLYTLPTIALVLCYLYEQHYRVEWERSIACNHAKCGRRPDYAVFILKYFMSLVVGTTSGFWIWTSKTITSWGQFVDKLLCRTRPVELGKPPLLTHV
uniref:Frizzled-7 n=1 Tax=Hofstenia miamia TaxID=442651 RepID=A0A068CJT9_HOFMI|nr:frizzled-7 [Hofstenia miamia]